jgi:hypothetical protein
MGNTVIIAPNRSIIAGPIREEEVTLIVDLDSGLSLPGAAIWIQPATTTARTSSGSTSTPRPAPPSLSTALPLSRAHPLPRPPAICQMTRRRTPKPPHQVPPESPIQLKLLAVADGFPAGLPAAALPRPVDDCGDHSDSDRR